MESKFLCVQRAVISALKEAFAGELEVYAFLRPEGLDRNYICMNAISKERQSAMLDKISVELTICIAQNTSKAMMEALLKTEQALGLAKIKPEIGAFELIGAVMPESRVYINKRGDFEGVLRHEFLLEEI